MGRPFDGDRMYCIAIVRPRTFFAGWCLRDSCPDSTRKLGGTKVSTNLHSYCRPNPFASNRRFRTFPSEELEVISFVVIIVYAQVVVVPPRQRVRSLQLFVLFCSGV